MAIVSNTGTSPVDSSTAIYALKTTLVSAGWSVVQSGTGTAGTYNSSGDSITSAGVLSTAAAWFLIQAPNGQTFGFQNENNSTGWRIMWNGSGGSIATDGDQDSFPTMTYAQYIRGNAGGYTGFLPTNNTYVWNVIADSSAPYGFWCAAWAFSSDPTAVFTAGLVFDPLTGTVSGDVCNYVVHVGRGNGTMYFGNYGYLGSEGQSHSSTQFYHNATYLASTTAAGATAIVPHAYIPMNTDASCLCVASGRAGGSPTNPVTGYDETFPIMWGRRAGLSNDGFKGVSTIMKMRGISRSNGDTFTVSTARDRISICDFSLPWDGSVPVL